MRNAGPLLFKITMRILKMRDRYPSDEEIVELVAMIKHYRECGEKIAFRRGYRRGSGDLVRGLFTIRGAA